MTQRRSSISSNGSAGKISQRPGLHRQNSSGSMTERSFREPSPNRHVPSPVPFDNDAPPVPPLPRGYISPPPFPEKSMQRSASVEPSERTLSPLPRSKGRGVSLDRGPGMITVRQDGRGKPRVLSLNTVGEFNHASNRDSVNFSRPMSPQNSPPSSPLNRIRQRPYQTASTTTSNSAVAHTTSSQKKKADNVPSSPEGIHSQPVRKKKQKSGITGAAEATEPLNTQTPDQPSSTVSGSGQQLPELAKQTLAFHSELKPSAVDTSIDMRSAPKRKQKKPGTLTSIRPNSLHESDSDTQSERSLSSDRPQTYRARPPGLLTKQPSIVREDREAEEKEEEGTSIQKSTPKVRHSTNPATSIAQSSSIAPENRKQHGRSASQPAASVVLSTGVASNADLVNERPDDLNEENAIRHKSLSLPRAAHFSSYPNLQVQEAVMHQPPARSVSPAKSALKHFSLRGSSPLGTNSESTNKRNSQALSEASDTISIISDEGKRNTPRSKKGVKVSFEESLVVGRAATPPTSPDSPVILSPQNRSSDKISLGNFQDKKQERAISDAGMDQVMQPTPTLPTFGSIREQTELYPTKADGAIVDHKSVEAGPAQVEASTDQMIGHVFAQDFKNRTLRPAESTSTTSTGSNPLSNEVTRVEGSGSRSKTQDDLLNANTLPPSASLSAIHGKDDQPLDNDNVPKMPGHFPDSSDYSEYKQYSPFHGVDNRASIPTPASVGIAEPEPELVTALHEPRASMTDNGAEDVRAQNGISDDVIDHSDDSIYSDAEENISDLEGDGFGSINAIVESSANMQPAISGLGAGKTATPQSETTEVSSSIKTKPSPLLRNEKEISEPPSDAGWDEAQAYWSGLSQTRKEQIEQAAMTKDPDTLPMKTKPKMRKKRSQQKTRQSSSLESSSILPLPDKQHRQNEPRVSSPQSTTSKLSMLRSPQGISRNVQQRPSPRDEGLLRSLQTSTQPPISSGSKDLSQKKPRPLSAVALVDYDKSLVNERTQHNRTATAEVAPKSSNSRDTSSTKKQKSTLPKLRRVKSDASDSSSSFKRSRSPNTAANRYTMRKSMREGATDNKPLSVQTNKNNHINVRSPSPSESTTRRPFSSSGASLRTSLRGAAEPGREYHTNSPSRFGFAKSPKAKSTSSTNWRFSSRFADSSDDEAGPSLQRSRFADSSDEEEMTPVRGIPRKTGEGDSTDLEDSSAETSLAAIKPSMKTHKPSAKFEGSALVTGSLRSPSTSATSPATQGAGLQSMRAFAGQEKNKRSFFGSLAGRKRDEPRVTKSDGGALARQDPPSERWKAESIATNDAARPAIAPKSPRLQRRTTPKRFASDTWPLPAMPPKFDSRPNTSDGNDAATVTGDGNDIRAERPSLGQRRLTVQSEAVGGLNGVVLGKSGKRKRFPRLRRAFGLHD